MHKLLVIITILTLSGIGLNALAQQNPSRIVMEEQQPEVKITFVENRLVIENLPKDNVLEIFNIMGVKVYNQRVKAGTNEYIVNLPKGFYIVKVGAVTKKIAAK